MAKKSKVREIGEKIAEVDKRIMKLIKQRVVLTKSAGKEMVDSGVDAADEKYEDVLTRSRHSLAKALDIEVKFVNTVFKGIIDYSKKAQKKLTKK